ncbi:MAG: hypothetical protein CL776_06135 [Chloroflexi bacterium]|nr:hypothetical protein [Chloroflexota bacterium]|tara:strand:+ start:723 stop:1883 length:1161 start_codon:yes stop_codon:yes gene_type:complete
MDYHLIETDEALKKTVELAKGTTVLSIDTESNSRHRFPERVCLIQIGFLGMVFIIDPIKVVNLEPLRKLLSNKKITKLFHGADYDVRGLNRDWGFEIYGIFDTYVAARLLGFEKLGLANLLDEVLKIEIPKDPAIQKQDWSIRPISNSALEYAGSDVAHLEKLSVELSQQLKSTSRGKWADEEFKRLEKIRYSKPNQEELLFRMKESKGLNSRGLAILYELLNFRTEAAITSARPPGYIIPSAALGILAADPSKKLDDVPQLSPGIIRRFGKGIHAAINTGMAAPLIERPQKALIKGRLSPYLANPIVKERLRKIKQWRQKHAEILKIDPALIWPVDSLKRVSLNMNSVDKELKSDDVRKWQKKEFGRSIKTYLKSMIREEQTTDK